jgi:hypothetical protein
VDGAGSVKVMMAIVIEMEDKMSVGHGAQLGVHTLMSIGGFQGRRGIEMDRSCGHNCAEKWRLGGGSPRRHKLPPSICSPLAQVASDGHCTTEVSVLYHIGQVSSRQFSRYTLHKL